MTKRSGCNIIINMKNCVDRRDRPGEYLPMQIYDKHFNYVNTANNRSRRSSATCFGASFLHIYLQIYDFMREMSGKSLEIIEEAIAKLESERKSIIAESTKVFGWLEHFADCAGNDEFARETLLTFIDKITVYENKSINIEFNFHDEMASCREIMHDLKLEVS